MKPSAGCPATAVEANQATTAPSMKNSPCATLTTRMTPNTNDRPSAVSASTAEVTRPSRAARRRWGPKCICYETSSQRLRRVVPFGLVEPVLDLGLVHDLQLAALDLGD